MNANKYQAIIRAMPCFHSRDNREGYISWHHLLCIGQHGKGMKAHPVFTIPVSAEVHAMCHSYEITREEQKEALIKTWCTVINERLHQNRIAALMQEWDEIDQLELGENETYKRKGMAFWYAIGGE